MLCDDKRFTRDPGRTLAYIYRELHITDTGALFFLYITGGISLLGKPSGCLAKSANDDRSGSCRDGTSSCSTNSSRWCEDNQDTRRSTTSGILSSGALLMWNAENVIFHRQNADSLPRKSTQCRAKQGPQRRRYGPLIYPPLRIRNNTCRWHRIGKKNTSF